MNGKEKIDPESQKLWDELYDNRPCCTLAHIALRKGYTKIGYRIGFTDFTLDLVHCPQCGRRLK